MKFPIEDFFSKCDYIRSFLRTWSHLLEKSLMENFIFWVQCIGRIQLYIQHIQHIQPPFSTLNLQLPVSLDGLNWISACILMI